jgi:DNA-binding MarR family transcriptional regulator
LKNTSAKREVLPELPCACASLRRAARAVTQLYDSAVRPTGLRATQFALLQALHHSGPIRQGRLGELLAMDTTTLTRTLALLAEQGWIRVIRGADRRERVVELAPPGRQKMREAMPHWERAQKRFQRQVGDEAWGVLQETLMRVTAAVQQG